MHLMTLVVGFFRIFGDSRFVEAPSLLMTRKESYLIAFGLFPAEHGIKVELVVEKDDGNDVVLTRFRTSSACRCAAIDAPPYGALSPWVLV